MTRILELTHKIARLNYPQTYSPSLQWILNIYPNPKTKEWKLVLHILLFY